MPTLMERGMSMLARALPAVAGGRIVYQRGEDRVTLSVGFGRTEFQVESSDGIRLVHSDRDLVNVPAQELIFGSQRAIPQRGDRFTLIDPSDRFGDVFEVLAPAGMDVYSEDPTGTLLRIHGKAVCA